MLCKLSLCNFNNCPDSQYLRIILCNEHTDIFKSVQSDIDIKLEKQPFKRTN